MKPVEITVRGSHAVTLPPEQATVYAQVSAEGAETDAGAAPAARPPRAAIPNAEPMNDPQPPARHHGRRSIYDSEEWNQQGEEPAR